MVGLLALLERCCCVNHRKFLTILPLKVCRGNQTLKNMPQEDNFKPNLDTLPWRRQLRKFWYLLRI